MYVILATIGICDELYVNNYRTSSSRNRFRLPLRSISAMQDCQDKVEIKRHSQMRAYMQSTFINNEIYGSELSSKLISTNRSETKLEEVIVM